MGLNTILARATKERKTLDHVAWRCVCPRCGIEKNLRGEEVKKMEGDGRKRPEKEYMCENPRCIGKLKVLYKLDEKRAIHISDIRRRT